MQMLLHLENAWVPSQALQLMPVQLALQSLVASDLQSSQLEGLQTDRTHLAGTSTSHAELQYESHSLHLIAGAAKEGRTSTARTAALRARAAEPEAM